MTDTIKLVAPLIGWATIIPSTLFAMAFVWDFVSIAYGVEPPFGAASLVRDIINPL